MADETHGWSIIVTPRAERELLGLQSQDQQRVRAALDRMVAAPSQVDRRKLAGGSGDWRLRVGDLRVLFRPDAPRRVYVVLRVLPRARAYRS